MTDPTGDRAEPMTLIETLSGQVSNTLYEYFTDVSLTVSDLVATNVANALLDAMTKAAEQEGVELVTWDDDGTPKVVCDLPTFIDAFRCQLADDDDDEPTGETDDAT